jgi:hypothetical protein
MPPTCGWNCVDAEFQAMALDEVVLRLVSRPESSNVRAHVRDAVEVARTPRVTDFDLRGYRGEEPGWIVDRICCLSVATEIRRMILGSQPAFERVRAVLENDPSANELMLRCRDHMRRAHNSCHFPASCISDLDGRPRQAHS